MKKQAQESYLVGYMLEGSAAAWHRDLAKDISKHFGTWEVHEKVSPHLTIFYPFDTENVKTVADLLQTWTVDREVPGTMMMNDFGRFDDTVVFAKIEAPMSIDNFVRELQSTLMEVVGPPRRGFREWNPHATLAHRVPKETMREIWAYVQNLPKPNFELKFDNVTLFKYQGERKWSVEQIFRFK